MMVAAGFLVSGRVQGVGFRYATRKKAESLGVCGSVRNRVDGQVEGRAWGEAAALKSFLEWLADGPRYARVSRVETWEIEPGQDHGFEILR